MALYIKTKFCYGKGTMDENLNHRTITGTSSDKAGQTGTANSDEDFGTMAQSMQWQHAWKRRIRKINRKPWVNKWRGHQLTRAKLVRNCALIFIGFILLGTLMATGLFAWYARSLPQPDKIVRKEGFSTKVLDRNDELLYEVYADQRRTPVTLDQIPEKLKQATIAIEDKSFYQHGGFDPKGIARAIYIIITQQRLVGGSTLTQQLVKNVLLSQEKTLARKVKEFILAIQIESKYSKDEILQMYLNEAPYGGTAWGVGTAAEIYFHKPVSELNLVESAILAGLPQRPSVYSPFSDMPQAYIGRTENVLRRMREDGYITKEEEASAAAGLAEIEFAPGLTSIKAPHFVLYVKKQLEEMYGEDLVEKGGLTVKTTLDYPLHEAAQTAVTEEIAKVSGQGIGNGAALVMDPKSGEILSMVGSKDFFAKDYDGQVNVTQSLRQPGSAIKPVTYLTALKKGYTPSSVLMDVPTDFPSGDGKTYSPVNYDGAFRGPVQLRFALGSSLNVPAVKLLALVGIKEMLKQAYDLGLTTLEPTDDNLKRFGLAVTLGGAEVKLIDLTTAYSAFANGGYKIEPVSILKVSDRNGKTLYEHKPIEGKRVIDEGQAFLMNHILSDNNARLLTFGANSYLNMGNRPIAVKTGTTNDKRDNWTIGWSDSTMVGVWVGNNDNSPMKQVASGVTGASPIWRRIMLEALKTKPANEWKIPETVEAKLVDIISGYPEHDGFPARSEYVVKGTLPTIPDPIHTKLKLCRGQDKLATELDISRNEYDEKEYYVLKEDMKLGDFSWQDAIDRWVASQGDPKYHPPTEYCGTQDEVAIRVESPADQQNFSGTEVPIKVRVITQGEVERVEIWVDGNRRETLTNRPYETTMTLSSGKHTVKIKAWRQDGKNGESGDSRIGVGGIAWDQGEPTVTPAIGLPSPSPVSGVTPTPTP